MPDGTSLPLTDWFGEACVVVSRHRDLVRAAEASLERELASRRTSLRSFPTDAPRFAAATVIANHNEELK